MIVIALQNICLSSTIPLLGQLGSLSVYSSEDCLTRICTVSWSKTFKLYTIFAAQFNCEQGDKLTTVKYLLLFAGTHGFNCMFLSPCLGEHPNNRVQVAVFARGMSDSYV